MHHILRILKLGFGTFGVTTETKEHFFRICFEARNGLMPGTILMTTPYLNKKQAFEFIVALGANRLCKILEDGNELSSKTTLEWVREAERLKKWSRPA
jgi:hypothetical protein